MRDDQLQPEDSAVVQVEAAAVWSAPQLTVLPIAEGTQGVNGPNFDGDFSPQS